MTYEPIWGPIISWYLFLAGLGAGAFITSAFLGWRHPEATSMQKMGRIIAPIAVAVGLVLLMVDAEAGLHNPIRFFYLLMNPGSVMMWGVVFLGLFMVVAIAAFVLDRLNRRIPNWLEIAGVVLAVCVAIYTGALGRVQDLSAVEQRAAADPVPGVRAVLRCRIGADGGCGSPC